jgi:hypothetical protein
MHIHLVEIDADPAKFAPEAGEPTLRPLATPA